MPEKKVRGNSLEFKITTGYIYQEETEIIYAEVYGHYMQVHCCDGDYCMRESVRGLLQKVSGEYFVEPHRGFIVNCMYIKAIEDNCLVLNDGNRILISRRKKNCVRKKMIQYKNETYSSVQRTDRLGQKITVCDTILEEKI